MPKNFVIALLTLAALLAVSCGGESSSESEPTQGSDDPETQSADHVDAGAGPIYPEPVRLTAGEYRSPATATQELREEGLRTQQEEELKPRFEGTVNGIRLYVAWNEEPGVRKVVCGGDKYVSFPEVDYLSFGYLPAGTFALSPQHAAICEDGSTAGFGQDFATITTGFQVRYSSGERAFPHDASAERISEGNVSGQDAVFIRPVNDLGYGRSYIAWATPGGLLILDASNMPFDESLKIAEGVQCTNC